MSKNPRDLLNEFLGGLQEMGTSNPEYMNAFMGLLGASYKEGALCVKTKELISVAIGIYNRCDYCIVFHVSNALKAGATREEIMEAAMVAVAFGAGPAMAYTVSLLKDSINEFEPDFKK